MAVLQAGAWSNWLRKLRCEENSARGISHIPYSTNGSQKVDSVFLPVALFTGSCPPVSSTAVVVIICTVNKVHMPLANILIFTHQHAMR